MRTRAECREVAVVAETAEAEAGTQAESPTGESYHVPRELRVPGRVGKAGDGIPLF